jgi:hypothetical protein
LVDLVVQGRLDTSGGSGNWVRFQPFTVPTSTTDGDEWGGIFFDWTDSTSTVANADIGYALTPISLFYQDVEVSNARIHHFGNRGIWICESANNGGPWVHDCTVFRDSTGTASLDPDVGRVGLAIEKCKLGRIENNTVDLIGGRAPELTGAGIDILNGRSWCSQSSNYADSLKISGNEVAGPGGSLDPQFYGSWSGVRGYYPCAASPHLVRIEENVFTGWNYAGIDFSEGIDVQVSCNRVAACRNGVEFTRSDPYGAEVRFRQNALEIGAYGQTNDQRVIRTDFATKSKFGPGGSTLGFNNIIADSLDYFILEDDENSTHTLNAVDNYWRRNGSRLTLVPAILLQCSKDTWVSDAVRIDVSSPESDSSNCAPSSQLAGRLEVNSEGAGDREPAAAAGRLDVLPTVTRLAQPAPSPSRGTVEVRFDLAGAERRHVAVEVFDVTGRRVRSLAQEDLPGGRYGLIWNGEDQRGEAVGAGVYFVRLRTGSLSEVRKAVLLR